MRKFGHFLPGIIFGRHYGIILIDYRFENHCKWYYTKFANHYKWKWAVFLLIHSCGTFQICNFQKKQARWTALLGVLLESAVKINFWFWHFLRIFFGVNNFWKNEELKISLSKDIEGQTCNLILGGRQFSKKFFKTLKGHISKTA